MKVAKCARQVAFITVVLALCSLVPVWAADKPIELSFSNFWPAPHSISATAEAWAAAVNAKTNGQVKVTLYHGGTLTPPAQCYDGVTKGLSDLGMSAFSYTRGRFALSEVVDLPLGYKSGLAATRVANAFAQKFNPKEVSDTQLMLLHAHGPGVLHTKKPVATLDDLKGMKISCTGLSSKVATKLGATPVAAPMSERYDSIQRGVSEGGLFPVESLKGWKLAEVVKHTTLNYSSAYTTTFFIVMNKDRWSSLPAEAQKAITEVNGEFIDKFGETWDRIDKEGAEFALAQGVQTINLSPEEDAKWAAAVQSILDEYVENMKSKGMPGQEALAFCMDTLKTVQK